MASVNKVIIVGNLGADPETRYLPSGEAVTNIRVATTDTWKDKASGEKKEATEWHRIAFFGAPGRDRRRVPEEGLAGLRRGQLRTRKWQDKDGQDRYTHRDPRRRDADARRGARAAASAARRLGARARRAEARRRAKPAAAAKKPAGKFDDMEDDIPF